MLRPMDLNFSDVEEEAPSPMGQENANAQMETLLAERPSSGRSDIRLPLQSLEEAGTDDLDRQSISFDDRLVAEDSKAASTKADAQSAVSHFAFKQAPALNASSAESSGSVQGSSEQLLSASQEFALVKEPMNSPTRYRPQISVNYFVDFTA